MLFRIRYETENQFPGDVPPHQTLGIREIPLAASRGAIRLRLRQIQLAVRLQSPPHRLPVLRGGLHHGFLHARCAVRYSDNSRKSLSRVPNLRRSKRNSPSTAASVMTTASILFCMRLRTFRVDSCYLIRLHRYPLDTERRAAV